MTVRVIISAVILAAFGFFIVQNANLRQKYNVQKEQNEMLQESLQNLDSAFNNIAGTYEVLSRLKTYSISLSPQIDTKVNSVLGSSKQLTFQYFFTMDGNAIKLSPDSTFILKK